MPPGFGFPTADTDLWSPYNVQFARLYNNVRMEEVQNFVVVRLKPGTSAEGAAADVNRINAELIDRRISNAI
jgi:hypothetical protein